MATLTSYDGSIDDTNNFGDATNITGQGFKLTSSATCTGFSMKGSRGVNYTGSAITISVCTAADGTGVVYTEDTTGSFLPAYTATPSFIDFTFVSSFALTADTQYYILITCSAACHDSDELRWSIDNTSPSYANGGSVSNSFEDTSYDRNFKIYGTVTGYSHKVYGITPSKVDGSTPSKVQGV